MTTKISEAKFEALKSKLRELFELDKSDLDFGIYRIMAAKNKEVTAFLDRHLRETVRGILESSGSDESAKLSAEIAKAREAAATAGFNPDDSPRVKELEEQYARLGGSSTEELEADIYNHLLNFFSRYYDEGDFISKRYYKCDTYALPYGGEEVTLHWANKDQYYIKSGEWHKDYRFRADGKTVHFRLVEATVEAGNNKEPDESKRRYILAIENPAVWDERSQTLTLRFEFRTPSESDEWRIDASEATRIFGGNYDKNAGRTKGDQREEYCADAEIRAIADLTSEWKIILQQPAPTAAKPKRTVLGRHLDHFTARNCFDYFVHKNLGAFLLREIDFYIKNEVVHLDDIETHSGDQLARIQRKVKAIKLVARHVITFLDRLESFQRKLWLKKKFVLESNWLISAGLLQDEVVESVAKNQMQWSSWESYGFRKIGDEAGVLPGMEWGSKAYIEQNPSLIIDTKFLGIDEKRDILSLISLDDNINCQKGTLINGENFNALGLMARSLAGKVSCVFVDPPFNTGDDGFPYKDGYMASSWFTFIHQSATRAQELMNDAGLFFMHIGDEEAARSRIALEKIFLVRKNSAVVRRGVKNVQAQFDDIDRLNQGHDTIHVCAKTKGVRVPHLYQKLEEGKPGKWDTFWRGVDRPTMRYELFGQNPTTGQWRWEPGRAKRAIQAYEHYLKHESEIKTLDDWYLENLQAGSDIDFVRLNVDEQNGKEVVQYYVPPQNHRLVSDNWLDISSAGNLTDFPHEKSLALLERVIAWSTVKDSVVLDYFAGSGTTGHSVIEVNRKDGGSREFVLVEMATYFDSILKPRMIRALTAKASSTFVKYFALESYEDALNNLPSPDGKLFEAMDQATRDSLITYSLDLELGPHLLNMDAFRDPWGYKIHAQLAGEDEVSLHNVDMVETFNYLIGLKVQAYGPIERYSADFVRLPHGDDKDAKGTPLPEDKREGRLRVEGRLRRDAEGPYLYQRVEGELNDGNATRVLVIWRKLTDNAEKDAAVLEAWMARHRESTKERSDYREYHLIYLNGPITLPQPTQELRTVLPTEQTFKDRMFEDTEV